MNKIYKIYAYKHYWVDDDPIPMPYTKDQREFTIEAHNEGEALAIAEKEYGSGERVDKNGKYVDNSDGSWTLMGVSAVEVRANSTPKRKLAPKAKEISHE